MLEWKLGSALPFGISYTCVWGGDLTEHIESCLGHSNRSCSLLVCESLNEESQEDNKCFFRALLKVRGGRDGGGLPEFLGPFHRCIFGQEIPMF